MQSALALSFISGAAALSHQLLWTRRLIDLLGASHASAARVFGCFFFGLAVGSALAAWCIPQVKRPWRWLAVIEVSIALLSVPAMTLPYWTGWVWPALGLEGLVSWRGGAVKLAASLLIVLPPAVAMGATLPLLGKAVLRGERSLGRQGVWLYAINTMGGVLGLGMTGFVLLQTLGGLGAMGAVAGLNICLAAICALFDRRDVSASISEPTIRHLHPLAKRRVFYMCLTIAMFSGLGVIAFEVATLQVAMLVAPLSFYAPAAVLMVIILLLAVGSIVTPALVHCVGPSERILPWAIALSGLVCIFTPSLFLAVAEGMGGLPPQPSFAAWLLKLIVFALLAFGPALVPAAFVFPLVLNWMNDAGGDPHGRQWGWLLAVNGVGGLLGAELMYRLMLPMWGAYPSIAAVGVSYLLVGTAAVALINRRWAVSGVFGTVTVGATAYVLSSVIHLPLVNPHIGFDVLAQSSGREGTVAVVEKSGFGRALLMSNQYLLGGTAARWDQERQAMLPMTFHADPKHVGFIGVATGITPGAALDVPGVEDITAIELSPIVADFAGRYFKPFNHGVMQDPRVNIVLEDGRTAIAAALGRFDVLVGDLFLPWGPGEARLYSREHFTSARMALRPGGVFCQWLAMYQLTPEQFGIIADTFAEVFEEVSLFQVGFSTSQPALAMVGFRDGALDWSIIAERAKVMADIGDPLIASQSSIALLYLGNYSTEGHTLNTLGNMRVELLAGRERVSGNPGARYLYGARWGKYLQGQVDSIPKSNPRSPEARLGLLLTQWAHHQEFPAAQSRRLARMIRQRMDDLGITLSETERSRWTGDLSWR